MGMYIQIIYKERVLIYVWSTSSITAACHVVVFVLEMLYTVAIYIVMINETTLP